MAYIMFTWWPISSVPWITFLPPPPPLSLSLLINSKLLLANKGSCLNLVSSPFPFLSQFSPQFHSLFLCLILSKMPGRCTTFPSSSNPRQLRSTPFLPLTKRASPGEPTLTKWTLVVFWFMAAQSLAEIPTLWSHVWIVMQWKYNNWQKERQKIQSLRWTLSNYKLDFDLTSRLTYRFIPFHFFSFIAKEVANRYRISQSNVQDMVVSFPMFTHRQILFFFFFFFFWGAKKLV